MIRNARKNEEIDINVLAVTSADIGVTVTHDGKIATVRLDSGAIGRNSITASWSKLNNVELRKLPYPIKTIGRNFITKEYCKLNKLTLKNLPFNIRIKSIHGDELSTNGIELQDLEVHALGQKAIIPSIQLILLNEGPADIIIGLETLRYNNVFGKLSRYFGTETDAKGSLINTSEDRTVGNGRCIERWPARKSDRTSIHALSTAGTPNLRYHTVHISDIIPNAVQDDDTDYLLPAEMYSQEKDSPIHRDEKGNPIHRDGIQTEADVGYQRDTELKFNIIGTEADKTAVLEETQLDFLQRVTNKKLYRWKSFGFRGGSVPSGYREPFHP